MDLDTWDFVNGIDEDIDVIEDWFLIPTKQPTTIVEKPENDILDDLVEDWFDLTSTTPLEAVKVDDDDDYARDDSPSNLTEDEDSSEITDKDDDVENVSSCSDGICKENIDDNSLTMDWQHPQNDDDLAFENEDLSFENEDLALENDDDNIDDFEYRDSYNRYRFGRFSPEAAQWDIYPMRPGSGSVKQDIFFNRPRKKMAEYRKRWNHNNPLTKYW